MSIDTIFEFIIKSDDLKSNYDFKNLNICYIYNKYIYNKFIINNKSIKENNEKFNYIFTSFDHTISNDPPLTKEELYIKNILE
jgi:hypothetical protein